MLMLLVAGLWGCSATDSLPQRGAAQRQTTLSQIDARRTRSQESRAAQRVREGEALPFKRAETQNKFADKRRREYKKADYYKRKPRYSDRRHFGYRKKPKNGAEANETQKQVRKRRKKARKQGRKRPWAFFSFSWWPF